MATIKRASVAIVSTTGYSEVLSSGQGALVTLSGYAAAFAGVGGDLELPWVHEQPHWSRFWASYLGNERVRTLGHDAAWDRVVPLRWLHGYAVTGPDGVDVEADVLLYPSAIVVAMRLGLAGTWPLETVSQELRTVCDATSWSIATDEGGSGNRSLGGIAVDLRDRAAPLLASGAAPSPDGSAELMVVAPTLGEGKPASFELTNESARACVAGLPVLGPPGKLVDAHLLEENSDTRWGARVYALAGGHAIWHPSVFLDPYFEKDPIACLHRNQTDLVGHVAALGSTVTWAASRTGAPGGIPPRVQPLVKRAAERLELLYQGNTASTYRSGLAKVRIEPLRAAIAAVKAEL